jgi:hypothetical protein
VKLVSRLTPDLRTAGLEVHTVDKYQVSLAGTGDEAPLATICFCRQEVCSHGFCLRRTNVFLSRCLLKMGRCLACLPLNVSVRTPVCPVLKRGRGSRPCSGFPPLSTKCWAESQGGSLQAVGRSGLLIEWRVCTSFCLTSGLHGRRKVVCTLHMWFCVADNYQTIPYPSNRILCVDLDVHASAGPRQGLHRGVVCAVQPGAERGPPAEGRAPDQRRAHSSQGEGPLLGGPRAAGQCVLESSAPGKQPTTCSRTIVLHDAPNTT